jgi:hypothetical protein
MDQLGLVWDRPSLAEAAARRDVGIQRAAEHAESECPGWGEEALNFLAAYAADSAYPFLAEDVIEAYLAGGAPPPADARAWGSVFKRASALKIIRRVGYAPARTSNASCKPLWSGERE